MGQQLTGNYSYSDADNDVQSGTTFKWYRSDNTLGQNKQEIASAISQTYSLTASDVNKYISFEVTPRDGTTFGTAVESVLRGPVAAGVLPVGLTAFNVSLSGSHVILNWTTSSEKDNKQFIIYRSNDDGIFSAISEVRGGGNSSIQKSYSYTDRMPVRGNNYYRLAQVDIDGTERILETKSVLFDVAKSELAVYPNPVYTIATVSFKAGHYSTAKLVDNNGKTFRILAIAKDTSVLTIDLSAFARGIYHLLLLGKGESNVVKVIKK